MNAFISWSGSRELSIARAVKEWLAAVVPEIRAFISPDLPKGKAWFDALAAELKGARIGFMCLAPPRVASEWQLVEAGAIWKAAARGGLFPLCFAIRATDVPEPLRTFQLTHFDREDFQRLAVAVAKLARPAADWTSEHAQAFERSWVELKAGVDAALSRPDDGVHTTRGFIHEVRGGWWERVRSERGQTLSWMWFEPSADGTSLTVGGPGFSEGGEVSSRWITRLVSIQAQPPQPMLEYYWEGRHPKEAGVLFGGKGTLEFTIADNGKITNAAGEFKDVCIDEARPPTTKLVDLQRATPQETTIMRGDDENEKSALADRRLRAWR